MENIRKLSLRKRLALELHRHRNRIIIREHKLRYLFWECTLRCNLACKHCGSDCKKSAGREDMPLKDFLRVIDSITPHVDPNKTIVVITGGEPLMHKEIEQCGQELYDRGYPWGMVTNGLAFTRRKFNNLLNAGLRSVTVSLDGLAEDHNAMRGNPNSFDKASETIKWLAEHKEDIIFDVVTCVTPSTFSKLNEIKDFLIENRVERWRIFTVFPTGRGSLYADLQLSPQEFKRLFDYIKQTRNEGRIRLDYGCEGFLGNYEGEVRNNFYACNAGVGVGSVLVDGTISACPSIRANFSQGNIYEDDFMSVWNNKFQNFRDREWMYIDECKNCKEFRYCQGGGMHLRNSDGKLMFCHLNRIEEGCR